VEAYEDVGFSGPAALRGATVIVLHEDPKATVVGVVFSRQLGQRPELAL
jgi:hypothetical protein